MSNSRILIIDDEPDILELLSLTLKRMGHQSDCAATVKEAMALLESKVYGLVLTDMRLPDGDGFDVIGFIQKKKPHTPVAVITAFGHVEGAVLALKAGAFDYVSKPINLDILKQLVQSALTVDEVKPQTDTCRLIGDSEVMLTLKQNIAKVARSQAPVFICGPSGSGKELVARTIHESGLRANKPFIPVNCGAIPTELMESEFFGHKKGAFTGAVSDKAGLFEAATGGTLFLDEIAELPLHMQVKLLRAIQEKAIKPIGALKEIPVDVRILSASHKLLQDEIAQQRFRQDLYYRINVIELKVPPLKQRLDDIPELANNIMLRLQGIKNIKLHPSCYEILKSYDYPGNVRELENILERALALSDGEEIVPDDLLIPKITDKENDTFEDLPKALEEHEKEAIMEALQETRWNKTAAAKLLGISFRTLRYRLKKLGID